MTFEDASANAHCCAGAACGSNHSASPRRDSSLTGLQVPGSAMPWEPGCYCIAVECAVPLQARMSATARRCEGTATWCSPHGVFPLRKHVVSLPVFRSRTVCVLSRVGLTLTVKPCVACTVHAEEKYLRKSHMLAAGIFMQPRVRITVTCLEGAGESSQLP